MSAHREPAETLFTVHLRDLAAGREPDAAGMEEVLAGVERLLAREMRRSGIRRLPPHRLGVFGYGSWEEPGALRELAVDAYVDAVVLRQRALLAQLEVLPSVDSLVATNVKRFLRDLQRRGDPLGYRAWQVAVNAARGAVERQTLVVVADDPSAEADPPVGAGTLLAVDAAAAARAARAASAGEPAEETAAGGAGHEAGPERPPAGEPAGSLAADAAGDDAGPERPPAAATDAAAEARRRVLAERAARWNAELLPDLVTARGRGFEAVAARLADLLPELGPAGVESFRLREVIAALRDDLRPRWLARLRAGAEVVPADAVRGGAGGEEADLPLPVLPLWTPAADPETAAVERDAERRLARCVEERLATLPADERTRQEAVAVWQAQSIAAAEGEPTSGRGLAETLRIPRDRMPRLIAAVRQAFEGCRRRLGLAGGEEEEGR